MAASKTIGDSWSRALVSGFPGPALVADLRGRVLLRNRAATGVLTVVEQTGERLRGDLGQRGAAIARENRSDRWVLTLDAEPGAATRSFLLAVMAVAGEGEGEGKSGPVVVFLAWETTLESSLRQALAESRAFFRDLVTGSGDFVWSTDVDGIFTYASPAGFAGRSAAQLHGMQWRDLFDAAADRQAAAEVFESTMAVEETDLWVGAGDTRRCYRVHANPLIASTGEQRGLRGVARDVTAIRREENRMAAIREGDRRLDSVLRDIEAGSDPDTMLTTAASGIVAAAGLDGCWIFQRRPNHPFDAGTATTLHVVPQRHARASAQHGAALLGSLATRLADENAPDSVTESREGWTFLAAPARHAATIMGVLCFGRQGVAEWDEADLRFIHSIAGQVAVAIRMVEHQYQLRRLTRSDALTGLLTRQAFLDGAGRRLAEHLVQQSPSALILIEVDDLKAVNDLGGFAAGDRTLAFFGHAIAARLRPGALAGRWGGNEFAVWLDGADVHAAEAMVEGLRSACAPLQPSFGISAGIAVLDPTRSESIEAMMRRAALALGQSRDAGPGGCGTATPAGQMQSPTSNQGETGAGALLEEVGT